MAIVSKAKITHDGKIMANEFIESDSTGFVSVNAQGNIMVNELEEGVSIPQFTATGAAKADEFVEY